jgi:hypothetical protein
MVMAIDALHHLDRHPEEARCLPEVDAGLHQPCRCGVPQDVRRDALADTGRGHRAAEALAHRAHRLAVPLDHRVLGDAEALPAPQVSQKARRQPDGRLTFLRLPGALGAAVEHAAIKVDVTAADRGMEGC